MRKYIILMFILFLYSNLCKCKSMVFTSLCDKQKDTEFIFLLTSDSIKYWDNENRELGGVVFNRKDCRFWKYDKNRCFFIASEQDRHSRYFSVEGDTLIISYSSSNIKTNYLYLREKVLKLTEDTLIMQVIDDRGEYLPSTYIKSKDQSSRLKNSPNLYNRRIPEPNVQKDTMWNMVYSVCKVYRAMNACPDTMNTVIRVRVNPSGIVEMAKYERTPPDSTTYSAFYSAFLSFVKKLPFKSGRDIETKETFEMEILLPCTFLTKERVEMKHQNNVLKRTRKRIGGIRKKNRKRKDCR